MKPSEIVNLEEGFKDTAVGNWLARKGAFGTKAAVTAQGAHMAKGQAELSKAAEGVLKAKLIQQLISGLENAVNSGIVFVPVPIPENKNSYNQYNFLIEKIILNEAMSVQDFAKQFINNLLSKYQITPDQKMQLDALTDDFQKAYKGPGKPIPEKEIQNLISFVFAVKSAQVNDASPEPTGAETVTTQRGVYDFAPGSGWTQTHKMIIGTSGRPVPQPLDRKSVV